jgi:transcriptional regulator with XRE-family HTH domain
VAGTEIFTASGRTIQVVRKFRLLSRAQLAALVGKSPSWVAAVEAGRITLKDDEIDPVAEALGVERAALGVLVKKAS